MLATRKAKPSYRTIIPLALVLSCHALPAAGQEHVPHPALEQVAERSWQLVDSGSVTSPIGIMAYSGGWYDGTNHQLCIFGGGHFNYSGNEVWCFDIATLEWRQVTEADAVVEPPYSGADQGAYANFDEDRYPGALFNPAGEDIETAAPMSRHTYDQLEYADGFGAILWGGYAWGDGDSPWCVECPDTWRFDFDSRRWDYLYDGSNPAPNETAGVGASAWSRHDGKLYAKVRSDTWQFDPTTREWRRLRTRGAPPWTIEGTLEYDPNRRVLYFFGGNYESNTDLWQFEIDRQRWRRLSPDGEGPSADSSNGPGMAFDTANDVLLIYYAGTVWVYDPKANTWETVRPDRHPKDASFVFGRFRYDPVNRGAWLHTEHAGRHATWFFRYRR